MDLKKLVRIADSKPLRSKVNDSAVLEEGVNIVYGAPGGGFPPFEQVEHIVDKETYEALSEEFHEKFHKEACEYYGEEDDDVDFMYSEAMEESCGFLSTVNPESEVLVEWEITKETDKGTIYAGLIGV